MTGVPQVVVAGCGRWGRNLVRAFHDLGALRAVVDVDAAAAGAMSSQYGAEAVDLDTALADPDVDAAVVAVPAAQHVAVARRALEAGKDVLVEKPMALRLADAEDLCVLADKGGRILMVGHVVQYHPAYLALQELVRAGRLGAVRYLYAHRLNLGRIRRQEDTLWSFAPHDVSMILGLMGTEPVSVSAEGAAFLVDGIADVTTTHLRFAGGQRAHVFVSWLHPFREQKLVVVGDAAMAVFDDGEPWRSKLRVYPHAVEVRDGVAVAVKADAEPVPVEPAEPLRAECRHFLDCVATRAAPRTDGAEGLAVLRVLEAAAASLGEPAPAPATRASVFVHESAYVDTACEIGEGTRIWHYSHVLAGSRIGRNCTLGQNVMIGPEVTVGDGCKIQNNVSVYRGVTLEDEVFCGPSCVFTNVSHPRAGIDRRDEFEPTHVGKGATIGANATIVCGHRIGPWAFVAAGAVVTADVSPHALVAGVPARQIGWVSHAGERLGDDLVCPRTGRRYALDGNGNLREVTAGDEPAPVPLVDLAAQRRRLGNRIERAVAAVIEHGQFILGPEVGRLEAALAERLHVSHAIGCSSGTDALLLGLLALGAGPGDAVFVPAFTFAAPAETVALVGATPYFVDVDAATFCLDAGRLQAAIDEAEATGLRPAGVIPVDLFGQPADYRSLRPVASRAGLWVIADAAQSLGARCDGRPTGALAEVTATSFFPAKPLGGYGDGGAVFTEDPGVAERVRSLQQHGRGRAKYDSVRIGLNARLDTVQAAVVLAKLEVFDEELDARRRVAERYTGALADLVGVPSVRAEAGPAWACYTITTPERDRIAAALRQRRIASAVYYPRPLHQQPAFAGFPVAPGGLPVSERLATEVLSLPIHPYLDAASQDRVIEAVRSAVGGG